MGSRGSSITFGLFVVVVLGFVFWLLARGGRNSWGMVAVLLGILLLRGALFVVNLRQQRRNAERGKGPVRIETRLGLDDDLPVNEPESAGPQDDESTPRP